MNKWMKKMVIIALIMIPVGAIIFVAGYFMSDSKSFYIRYENGKFVYSDHGKDKYELELTKLDSFENCNINIATGDIHFVASDSYGIEYTTYGEEPSYEVKDGILSLECGRSERSSTIVDINLNFNSSDDNDIYIYYPEQIKDDIFYFDNIKAESAYGDISIDGINCNTMSILCNYGDIKIDNALVKAAIDISSDYGDCNINNSTIMKTDAKLSYGSFKAEGGSLGITNLELSCGDAKLIDVLLDNIDAELSLGDFKAAFINEEELEYNLDLCTSLGDVEYNGKEYNEQIVINEKVGDYNIKVENSCGDIKVDVE